MSDHTGLPSISRTPAAGPHDDDALVETLGRLGYDIEAPHAGDPLLGPLVARRDQGDRAVLFTADAGGRFRAEITWRIGEWPSILAIAGIPARVVDGVTRSISVAGQTDDEKRLVNVLAELEALMPWANDPGTDGLHSGEQPFPR